MQHVRPHEKLVVWQKSYALCLEIYRITKSFPESERFGLTSQMRRAASSVPINIAEGNAKRTSKDRKNFLTIAHASLEELHCECRLGLDLAYLSEKDFLSVNEQICKISYLLNRLALAT